MPEGRYPNLELNPAQNVTLALHFPQSPSMGCWVTFGASLTHPVVLVWGACRPHIALHSDKALGVGTRCICVHAGVSLV